MTDKRELRNHRGHGTARHAGAGLGGGHQGRRRPGCSPRTSGRPCGPWTTTPAIWCPGWTGPDGWFNQLEHVLEPLDGGRARLHYVHSGIFAENWDQQYDGASKHTEFYLHTLGQYLQYFDGKPVVFTDIQAPPASAGAGRLCAAQEGPGC